MLKASQPRITASSSRFSRRRATAPGKWQSTCITQTYLLRPPDRAREKVGRATFCGISYFPWAGAANRKRHIESHYPTQAKGRLEWGTQHLLPVRRKRAKPAPSGAGFTELLTDSRCGRRCRRVADSRTWPCRSLRGASPVLLHA